MGRVGLKYCIVRQNTTLRLAIRTRIKSMSISTNEVLRRAGEKLGYPIDKSNFSNYLSGKAPKQISQYDLLFGICQVVGIKVSVKTEIEDEE